MLKKTQRAYWLFSAAIILTLAAGCASQTPTATAPTLARPTTAPPTQAIPATTPPSQPQPATALPQPTAAAPKEPASPPQISSVQIFLIALEDNGQSGEAVGCGDSAVPVDIQVSPTPAPLRAALESLLAIKTQYYGESGLYNALYQSDLRIESLNIDANGKATVKLAGQMALGGECDDPRFEAQIEKTVMQFSTVKSAEIFINDTPLDQAVSEK